MGLFCLGGKQVHLLETFEIGVLEEEGLRGSGDTGSEGPTIVPRVLVVAGCGYDLLCCLSQPEHPGSGISEGTGYVPIIVQYSLNALRGSMGAAWAAYWQKHSRCQKPGLRPAQGRKRAWRGCGAGH